MKSIEWVNGKVRLIDQTKLPEDLVYLEIGDHLELCDAIKKLKVRGAPAIGIAGAFGVVLGVQKMNDKRFRINSFVNKVINDLRSTRPTAKNLFWAVERMYKKICSLSGESMGKVKKELLKEALDIYREDEEISRKIGENGVKLLKDECSVLTHCNTGFLVTAGIGTALGIVYTAVEKGKKVRVYVDETRPLLQGARLTAWELKMKGIDVTLICDNTTAFLMKKGMVDYVFVGADRIASNGDTANKIGTYNLAVLAEKHNIPFYVAAPYSTFDFSLENGGEIPIEERNPEEVYMGFGKRTAPENVNVFNPAFDVTPNSLITAFITEEGIFYPPYGDWENLKKS
ncbi:MAG: S-methyl-5-thioribose-1-phosphate isomerase [Candidatus Helarchaeota archaeon]|nr:S-methyl-5-thioribose-1-phosphate isomerase [Candidatus Helarchaeota archaeon]